MGAMNYTKEDADLQEARLSLFAERAGADEEDADLTPVLGESSDEDAAAALPVAPPAPAVSRLVVAAAASAGPSLGSYVVSLHSRSRFRRLHRVGDCWRRPGLDFLDYEVLGADLPDSASYDAACKDCFRTGTRGPSAASSAQTVDLDPSSGSSSDSGGSTLED